MAKNGSCGFAHSALVDEEGGLWMTGSNVHGQLGFGDCEIRDKFTFLMTSIVSVSCGGFFTLALDSNGHVWAWGNNQFSQLGKTASDIIKTPEMILGLPKISAVATGDYHSLFLTVDGKVLSCGRNDSKQLGIGNEAFDINCPIQQLHIRQKIIQISAGSFHSLFLDDSNVIWGCGDNSSGQVYPGHGTSILPFKIDIDDNEVTVSKISAGSNVSAAIDNENNLWVSPVLSFRSPGNTHYFSRIRKIELPEPCIDVTHGESISFALTISGKVYCIGENVLGQIGTKESYINFETVPQLSSIGKVKSIAAGKYFSLFINSNGEVYGSGVNRTGQLGIPGDDIIRETPQQILIERKSHKSAKK